MYKVFLAEDEIVVREGIRNSIPWDTTPYTLAGEAPDGEMALSMIEDIKPDILVTDIRMPFMDGLALSRIIKKTLPWIKIIILSGHDEFEYAREAISVGVEEYLLKPVSSREMLAALDKVALHIDKEQENRRSIESLKARVESSTMMLRDKWLSDFMNRRTSAAAAIDKGREFGVELLARSYAAVVIRITAAEEQGMTAAGALVRSMLEKQLWFEEDPWRFVCLIKESAGAGGAGIGGAIPAEEAAKALAQAVIAGVERNTECRAAAGIGPRAERIGEIPRSYQAADKIAAHCLSKGLFLAADSGILPEDNSGFDPSGLVRIDGDMFLTRLKYASKKDIDSIIAEYTRGLPQNFEENHMLVYFIFGEIIVAASKLVEALHGVLGDIVPFSLDRESIHGIAGSRDIFQKRIRSLLEAVIEYRDAHTAGRYQSVIVKTREYIDRHFAGDISLYSTASHVGISPNHLSTVFAQETGENFIEYLTRVRLEKAKQLLKSTGMKSADIAHETGFSDPHYFSYVFKQHVGMSPREYRAGK